MFHDNVIPPLYYTACRCRHPRLRRTALALLKEVARVNPREALWDARYLVPVVERVIELEEGGMELGHGTQGDHGPPFGVPDELRVREVLINDKVVIRKDPTGAWITILRKLHGAEGEWDSRREWVPIRN